MKIRVSNPTTGTDFQVDWDEFQIKCGTAFDGAGALDQAESLIKKGLTAVAFSWSENPWELSRVPEAQAVLPPSGNCNQLWAKHVEKLRANEMDWALYAEGVRGEPISARIIAGFYKEETAREAASSLSFGAEELGVRYGVLDLRRAAPKENSKEEATTATLINLLQRVTFELRDLAKDETDDPHAGITGWTEIHQLIEESESFLSLTKTAPAQNVNVNVPADGTSPEKVNRLHGLDLEDSADLIARPLAAHIRNAFEVRLNDRDRRAFNDEVVEEIRPLIVAELVKLDAAT